MFPGWLSETTILPTLSREIHLDDESVLELKTALFQKEQEVRAAGPGAQHRAKVGGTCARGMHCRFQLSSLRNSQRQWIKNRNVAVRDEFVRQQANKRRTEAMKRKVSEYDRLGLYNVSAQRFLTRAWLAHGGFDASHDLVDFEKKVLDGIEPRGEVYQDSVGVGDMGPPAARPVRDRLQVQHLVCAVRCSRAGNWRPLVTEHPQKPEGRTPVSLLYCNLSQNPRVKSEDAI